MEDKNLLQNNGAKAVSGSGGGEIIMTNNPPESPPFELTINRNCPACGSSNCTRVMIDTLDYEYTCNDCGYVCRRGL